MSIKQQQTPFHMTNIRLLLVWSSVCRPLHLDTLEPVSITRYTLRHPEIHERKAELSYVCRTTYERTELSMFATKIHQFCTR